MTTTAVTGFLTRTRWGAARDVRTDAELVREFAATGSEGAFAELVRRFAPMVWGVCRRVVGHRECSEDAFQAVFLVLVRKPTAIRPPAAVGAWLHGVAVHTSLRARAMVERRRRWESLGATVPDRAMPEAPESPDPDVVRVLDEEIARLPDKLRAAVVLCELDGLSRRDAAQRLGIVEGTLSSRLGAARRQLAQRLRSRGVALGTGGIAVALGGRTAAAPPVFPTVSEPVSALADGAIRTMFLSKLKLLTATAMAALALIGVALTAYRGETSEPPRPALPVVRAAPVPKPKAVREGTILIWVDEKPLLLKPDGTELESPDPIPNVQFGVGSGNANLSPDGTRVAFEMQGAEYERKPGAVPAGAVVNRYRTNLKILDLGGKKETKSLDSVQLNGFNWLGDGKTLHLRGYEIGADGVASEKLENWVYDPATDKRTSLKVPADFVVRAIGPDGKTAVVDEWKMGAEKWHQHAHLWTIGTEKPAPLFELNQSIYSPTPKFSPDGKRVLCKVLQYGTHTALGNGAFNIDDFKCNNVVVIDLATKKQTVVKELGENPEWAVCGLAWSPDGRKIAYVETKRLPRPPGARADQNPYRVMIADPDGKNAKEIHTAQGSWLVGFDWK
ncbi:sigma-70 family RNA polymerase sigma factor [Gemmata sp. G18]|uniref:Sigma-70 family RNA polymerase sigma factor n=1 Tax=Gemmata palustris TaxID=2822762 RepID=A0ABS5BTZ2_9BACT|nr:sigma-70 family RNA polymerase sigma factor [Gemmata palustris]MBP3957158.1 sigma-70 family RNA polymerase sigma factor [Gemmata palustris]